MALGPTGLKKHLPLIAILAFFVAWILKKSGTLEDNPVASGVVTAILIVGSVILYIRIFGGAWKEHRKDFAQE